MKILVIAGTFHPPWATGYTSYVKGLIQSILTLGNVEVSIISTMRPRQYLYKIIGRDYFKRYHEEFNKLLQNLKAIVYLEEQSRNRVRSLLAIMQYIMKNIRGEKYDIIHDLYGLDAYWLVNHSRKAGVLRHLITPSVRLRDRSYSALLRAESICLKRIIPVFSSKYVAKSYGYGDNYKYIVPPAIDTDQYRPLNRYRFYNGYDYCLLYLGPLIPSRFPLQILKALKIVREHLRGKIVLKIVTGSWRCELESKYINNILELAYKLGLKENIILETKGLTENEKVRLYNQCDVLLYVISEIPRSIVPVDPPITPLEAMACAKPVITTRYFSLAEIIRHNYNGLLVNSLNESVLTETILTGIVNSKELGWRARRTVEENFSLSSVAKQLRRIYFQVAEK